MSQDQNSTQKGIGKLPNIKPMRYSLSPQSNKSDGYMNRIRGINKNYKKRNNFMYLDVEAYLQNVAILLLERARANGTDRISSWDIVMAMETVANKMFGISPFSV